MKKVICLEPLGVNETLVNQFNKALAAKGFDLIVAHYRIENENDIINFASEATVLVGSNIPINANVINNCKNLQLIAVAFTGVDHIDLRTCKEKNIAVCNAAGYATQAVAELTIGLIISVLRKISELDLHHKKVQHRQGFLGSELLGKTAGIVGYGAIGSKVAQLLHAFGCNILVYSRSEKKSVVPVQFVSLEELLRKSDIVSLHVPLNDATYGMIGARALRMMRKNAIIINCARGAVVQTAALVSALHSGLIAGAGLDIYDTEPPLDEQNPLFDAPNIVMAPHIAYATKEAIEKRFTIVTQNILQWIDGTPQNRVL